MKKRLTQIAVALVALVVVCTAGLVEPMQKLSVSDIATSGGAPSTNSIANPVSGEIVGVYLKISGHASADVTVTITSSSAGTLGVAQTIFSQTNLTLSAVYPVTDLKCSNGGVDVSTMPAPIYLYGDYVSMVVSNEATNVATDVQAVLLVNKQ